MDVRNGAWRAAGGGRRAAVRKRLSDSHCRFSRAAPLPRALTSSSVLTYQHLLREGLQAVPADGDGSLDGPRGTESPAAAALALVFYRGQHRRRAVAPVHRRRRRACACAHERGWWSGSGRRGLQLARAPFVGLLEFRQGQIRKRVEGRDQHGRLHSRSAGVATWSFAADGGGGAALGPVALVQRQLHVHLEVGKFAAHIRVGVCAAGVGAAVLRTPGSEPAPQLRLLSCLLLGLLCGLRRHLCYPCLGCVR